ncbi:MAG: hypothetical protein RLZZ502_1640 [Pseudomonadota bacterium]
MWVIRPGIALHLFDHGITKGTLGQHAFHCVFEHAIRKTLLQFGEVGGADTAWEGGVAVVELLLCLVTGDHELVNVGDNDKVSRVHVGGESRLVFASQAGSDLGSKTAKHLTISVYHKPLLFDIRGFC